MASSLSKLAMIAFDAAEIAMIEAGIAAGWMPELGRLRREGAFVHLKSDSDLMVGTVWPSFYSGLLPPEHGICGVVQWRPDQMRHDRPDDPTWLDTTPFYRRFGSEGPEVLAIDMPFAPSAGPMNGAELISWNAHATRGRRGSWPAGLIEDLRRKHGAPEMHDETYGVQSEAALLRLRDELSAAARQQSAISRELIGQHNWDLLLVGLGSVHRGGHKLQPPLIVKSGTPSDELDGALREVYRSCDKTIGEIAAGLPPDCTLIVFSLNGMVPNKSHHFVLPEMLRRILDNDRSDRSEAPLPPQPPLERLRSLVPLEVRSRLKEHLPLRAKDRLGRFWRKAEAQDWSHVRAFRLIGSDFEGQVRLNVKGRERDGIVEPEDAPALCAKIADGLVSFVDADTGEPLVSRVLSSDDLWPESRSRGDLPDLVVLWADRSPMALRALRSPDFGAFRNPWFGTSPDGRSGHHQPLGWALASGAGIRPVATGGAPRPVQDLTATILAHFGVSAPEGMRGEVLEQFLTDRWGD